MPEGIFKEYHGPAVVVSCHYTKCEAMRKDVELRGHAMAVCFYPGVDRDQLTHNQIMSHFGAHFGENIAEFVQSGGHCIVICSDKGPDELGKTQQSEIVYIKSETIDDKPIEPFVIKLEQYKKMFPVGKQLPPAHGGVPAPKEWFDPELVAIYKKVFADQRGDRTKIAATLALKDTKAEDFSDETTFLKKYCAGFEGHGGAVVVSCPFEKCDDVSALSKDNGHAMSINIGFKIEGWEAMPKDQQQAMFGMKFGHAVAKYFKKGSTAIVITKDDGSFGETQKEVEIHYLEKNNGYTWHQMTVKNYKECFPAADKMAFPKGW